VVLCAHFDTMINTTGAMDNASGVAALLALAEELRGEELPYALEFIAFNGEEYLPIGDDEYVRRAGDSFDRILFALNIDGIGPFYTSSTITLMEANPAFQTQVEQMSAAYPGVVWVEPWPESNHSTFAMRGVPALAFSSLGARHLAHTPKDTLDIIDPQAG
jgi:aminopeptidase YwaD